MSLKTREQWGRDTSCPRDQHCCSLWRCSAHIHDKTRKIYLNQQGPVVLSCRQC